MGVPMCQWLQIGTHDTQICGRWCRGTKMATKAEAHRGLALCSPLFKTVRSQRSTWPTGVGNDINCQLPHKLQDKTESGFMFERHKFFVSDLRQGTRRCWANTALQRPWWPLQRSDKRPWNSATALPCWKNGQFWKILFLCWNIIKNLMFNWKKKQNNSFFETWSCYLWSNMKPTAVPPSGRREGRRPDDGEARHQGAARGGWHHRGSIEEEQIQKPPELRVGTVETRFFCQILVFLFDSFFFLSSHLTNL